MRILEMAQSAGEDDLVIALCPAAALLVARARPHPCRHQSMTASLLASSTSTRSTACASATQLVQGRPTRQSHSPATLIMALSDVIGNPLDVIASGPTVPDQSTWDDAWRIAITNSGIARRHCAAFAGRAERRRAGHAPNLMTPSLHPARHWSSPTTPWPRRHRHLHAAESQGYNTLLLTTYLEGEASQVAKVAVGLGREIQAFRAAATAGLSSSPGETTVTLARNPGMGGRNRSSPYPPRSLCKISPALSSCRSPQTEPTAPPTAPAALADAATVLRNQSSGLGRRILARHDAYYRAVNDLLLTSPRPTSTIWCSSSSTKPRSTLLT